MKANFINSVKVGLKLSYLVTIICLLLVLISIRLDKKIYNPFILFNIWWGLTIFMSGLGLFEISVPTKKTYLIMLTAIVSYNIPFLIAPFIAKRFKIKINPNFYLNLKEKYFIYILLILQLVCVVFLAEKSIAVIKMLSNGFDFARIRYAYYYDKTIMNGYDLLIQQIIISPILFFNLIFVSLKFFNKNYSKHLPLVLLGILTVLSIGLLSFSSGSRGDIFELGIIIVFTYLIQNKNIGWSVFKNYKIWLTILIFVSVLGYITIARGHSEGGSIQYILKMVILYFSAPYIYFEKIRPLAMDESTMLYGATFFGGIIDIVILTFKFFGSEMNTISYYIAQHNQLYLNVGKDNFYNAFPTMVYSFLYDFKCFGMIIGPFLFGLLSYIPYFLVKKTDAFAHKGIYIMIILMIYQSPMKWIGIEYRPWIIIFIFLIYHFVFSDGKDNKRFE